MTTNTSGNKVAGSDIRYTPFGQTRDNYDGSNLPTDRRYTGQREVASLGLYNYNARYYDPYIGRFIQADTIIPDPGNSQDLNRYTYVNNNPLIYVDPSGHSLILTAIALGVVGGAIGGAIYGYGSQVAGNLSDGMDFGQALTTNIDPTEVGKYTLIGSGMGAVLGVGVGVVGEGVIALKGYITAKKAAEAVIGLACADGDCTDEVGAAIDTVCSDGDCTNEIRAVADEVHAVVDRVCSDGDCTNEFEGVNNIAEQINCFEAGTTILALDGSVAIESIKTGDYVLAVDSKTGIIDYYPVIEVFSRKVTSLLELTIGEDVLYVTTEHPFWVYGRGWIVARDLGLGDCIRSLDSTCGIVISLQIINKNTTVYNFTVDVAHNYFVGNGHWLSHNQCGGNILDSPAQDILSGTLKRKFPGQYLTMSLREIRNLLREASGKELRALQTAKKLLEQQQRLMEKVGGR